MLDTPAESLLEPPAQSEKARKRAQRKLERRQSTAAEKGAYQPLAPRNATQARLMQNLSTYPVNFALGPAGTGKTYVASRMAMRRLLDNQISRIIVTRPTAAPARHRLGFQPGGQMAKMRPWLVPIWDGFRAETSMAIVDKLVQSGKIEIVPFEHMRGRSFEDSWIVADEIQNATYDDVKMLITRLGEDSMLVMAGDGEQDRDLDRESSGLMAVASMVERFQLNAGIVVFSDEEVVRSAAVREWVKAFRKHESSGFSPSAAPGFLRAAA